MTNKITKVYKNWVEYDIYASGWAAWTGDVTWPSSSTDADIALFNWATWKIIKDSWKKLSDYQTALSTQTAYSSKGTATKVPTITTNTLWQVTAISETNITFPVTSVNSATWAVTVNAVPWTWTTWHVLTKTASGYAFSAAPVTSVWGSTWAVWLKTINNNSIVGSWNISITATETVYSWDSGTSYIIKVSTSAPASWTASNVITFVK